MKSMITVVEYDVNWPKQFELIENVLRNALSEEIISIEHVGSTSVPGLAAKPILDIDIIVSDVDQLEKIRPILDGLGYRYMGDQGINDRYAFKALSNYSPDMGTGYVWQNHNLYCCLAGSLSLQNHIMFRDTLRHSTKLASEYGKLKRRLSEITDDIDRYVELKSEFIADILNRAGIDKALTKDIIEQNRKK